MSGTKPKIVCYSCKFGWGYLGDESALAAQIQNWIPIICAGKLETGYVVEAFTRGADGVLILGCAEGDCHFQDGNIEARKRLALLRQALATHGVQPERVKLVLSRDPQATTIPALINDLAADISKLGPVGAKAAAARIPA